jgi:DMSO reductase family type II enzyme heme b subunit
MAAVQLFQGSPEPFLGMGASDRPVDVWLWRAGWKPGADALATLRAAYPHLAVDQYAFQQFKEFLTARAAGNLQADPARAFTGSNIQAKGFGSATMRPKISQQVSASGSWSKGRWTVVLRRPLQVPAEAGLPLAPGAKLSAAFALWDGAARDRNGQKLVSIWHDLELE